MKTAKTWPERIGAILDKHGLTQVAFASQLEVHESLVSRWVNGEREPRTIARKVIELIESGKIRLANGKTVR